MARPGRRTARARSGARTRLLWGGGTAAALLVVALALVLLARPGETPPLLAETDPAIGSASAPLTIYEFADLQCPYCQRFELQVLPGLERDYVETGQLRIVLKDFPIVGPDSWAAAQASEHVWKRAPQDYPAWRAGLYAMQGQENDGWASLDSLVAYSSRFASLDLVALARAVQTDAELTEVRADLQSGRERGVSSTPTLVIEGKLYNANDEAAVRAAIDEALGR